MWSSIIVILGLAVVQRATGLQHVVKKQPEQSMPCTDPALANVINVVDKCWTTTFEDHVTAKKNTHSVCCPESYFCCEGDPIKKTGKPQCCPQGSICKTDGTCEFVDPMVACLAWGDPHFTTFDGTKIDYQGTCRTMLVETTDTKKGTFKIYSKSDNRYNNNAVSYIYYLEAELTEKKVWYRLQRDSKTNNVIVTRSTDNVDGKMNKAEVLKLPYYNKDDGVNIKIVSGTHNVIFSQDGGVALEYDGVHTAKVHAVASFKGQVKGLCGNYDGKPENDLVTADGQQLKASGESFLSIGNSWVVKDGERGGISKRDHKECAKILGPISTAPWHVIVVKGMCGVLIDPKSEFKDCAAALKSRMHIYYEDCVFDGTYYGYPSICEYMKAVIDECREIQVPLPAQYEPKCIVGIEGPDGKNCPK